MPIYFYILVAAPLTVKYVQLCVEKLSQNISDSPWIQKKVEKRNQTNDIINVKMPQNLICNSQNSNQNSWNWFYNSKNCNSAFLLKGK